MMAEGKSKAAGPTVRRTRAPKKIGKLPSSTFEEWLRLQVIKPAETKPEVRVPSDSYEEWIHERVEQQLEVEG